MVFDQAGAHALDFVGADRCADAAAADCHAAFHLARHHCFGKRDNEVRIIIVRSQLVGAEINDLMPGGAELGDQRLLKTNPAVIRGNSDTHNFSFCSGWSWFHLRVQRIRPSARSALITLAARGPTSAMRSMSSRNTVSV